MQYPLGNAPVWRYIAKNGLKSPRVEAVEEFRKAVGKGSGTEAATAATTGQKKSP